MAGHDDASVSGLIERIVREARLPGEAARDDLRHELETHFDEVAAGGASTCQAMVRFGSAPDVSRSFRRVYRWDFLALYAAKLLIAGIAGIIAAEMVMAAAHLRVVGSSIQLAPGFFSTYGLAIKIVPAMAAAWEICRKPLSLARAGMAVAFYGIVVTGIQASMLGGLRGWEPWHIPALIAIGVVASRAGRTLFRLPLMFAGFTSYLLATVTTSVTPRPLVGAALVVIWLVTENLFSLVDRAFNGWFAVPMETAFTSTTSGRASS